MKVKPAVVIGPSGEVRRIDMTDQLTDSQEAVGGWIEPVKVRVAGKLQTAYINEEGKLKGLKYNSLATSITENLMYGDYIAGPLVIIGTVSNGVSQLVLDTFNV